MPENISADIGILIKSNSLLIEHTRFRYFLMHHTTTQKIIETNKSPVAYQIL